MNLDNDPDKDKDRDRQVRFLELQLSWRVMKMLDDSEPYVPYDASDFDEGYQRPLQ